VRVPRSRPLFGLAGPRRQGHGHECLCAHSQSPKAPRARRGP
jgi:hypothetical protein